MTSTKANNERLQKLDDQMALLQEQVIKNHAESVRNHEEAKASITRIEENFHQSFRKLEALILQQQQGNLTNERDRDDEISRLTEVPTNQISTSQQPQIDAQTPSIVSEIKQGFPRMDIFEILENESRGVSCLHQNRALESERGFGKFKVNIKCLRVPGIDETGIEINPEDIPPDYANALQVNIVKGGLLSKIGSNSKE